jgi:hypothetical protein
MMWGRDPDELKAEIEEAAEIAEEIAGPIVDQAATDTDPDEVRIRYIDGRTNKVSKAIAKELIARGQAELM